MSTVAGSLRPDPGPRVRELGFRQQLRFRGGTEQLPNEIGEHRLQLSAPRLQ